MAAAKKQCFFTSIIQKPRFTNDYEFGISVNTYQ